MRGFYRGYMAAVFLFLAGFGLFSVVMPEREYSENENRYLQSFPEVSAKGILSGEYQEKFEKALDDQFIGRDAWMKSATVVEKLMGYQEISDVYLGEDDYLLQRITERDIDLKQYLKNLRSVEYLGVSQPKKVSLVLVPSPGTVLSDKLPEDAPFYDAEAMYTTADTMMANARHINVLEELQEYALQNQVYYHTDHHWTLFGAYAAYSRYCEDNEFEKHTYGYFAAKKVTDSFQGTMYSKVLAPGTVSDTIYAATNIPQCYVECDGVKKSSIYDVEKLTQKNKYDYFFGGNYGQVTIKMKDKPKKKLLIIKDSFANSFTPFLMEDYDQITMLDLRFYQESVQKLLSKEKFNHILVLYELSNFAGDKNVNKLAY